MQVIVHRRQFAISRRHEHLPPAWRRRPIGGGYTLSHCGELNVEEIDDALGGGLRLGMAFGGGEDPTLPMGRYATVKYPSVQTDAAGVMGLLYTLDADNSFIITSSAAIACSHFGGVSSTRVLPRENFNWHPSPGSPIGGWSRLMADQRLDLARGTVKLRRKSLASNLDEDRAVTRMVELMRSQMLHVAPRFERVLLPMTAGLDSRTIFAALLAAGVPFETFTQVFGENSRHDAMTAEAISRRYGIAHRNILSQGADPALAHALSRHQLDSVHDADITVLFPHSMYSHVRPGDVMLRGSLFELGRLDYHGRLYGLDFNQSPASLAVAIAHRFGERASAPLREALTRWIEHRAEFSLDLELGDAFYFDQDIGGWLSAVEQGLDCLPAVSIHPANSLEVLRCLMSTDRVRRRSGTIQRRMIAQVDPKLDQFEYNPVRQLRQRLRGSSLETAYYRLRTLLDFRAT